MIADHAGQLQLVPDGLLLRRVGDLLLLCRFSTDDHRTRCITRGVLKDLLLDQVHLLVIRDSALLPLHTSNGTCSAVNLGLAPKIILSKTLVGQLYWTSLERTTGPVR